MKSNVHATAASIGLWRALVFGLGTLMGVFSFEHSAIAATWVPGQYVTYTGEGWIPSWVDGHWSWEWEDGYWETQTVDGHWEDQWVEGHEESVWIDGYWDNQWVDGYWEESWVDGYWEEQWNDGHWEDQWVDGYYDDEGNWNDGYTDSVWVDGEWSTNWVDGHSEWNWVDGYWEETWVDGHPETQWVDGYWTQEWIPESTQQVWVPGYYSWVWYDGYWTLVWGTWTVTVWVDAHWEGAWTWTAFSEPAGDWSGYSNWSPEASSVPCGQSFTQSRTASRPIRTGERNEAGDERNVSTGTETTTQNQSATGTQPTPFDEPVGDWFNFSEWSPATSTVPIGQQFQQSRTASRNRRTGLRDCSGNELNVSTYVELGTFYQNAVGTGGSGASAQTISFYPLPNRSLSDGQVTLNASATSGLAVTFSVSGNATLSGNVLTPGGSGSISVTASQPGNGTYGPAASITRTFMVSPSAPPISVPLSSIPGTAASPMPVPSGEVVWFDVDRDGILDEIIPANSHGFGYDILVNDQIDSTIDWTVSPVLIDGVGAPLWAAVPVIHLTRESTVDQIFYFQPEPGYEYIVFGEWNHRYGDRIENWTLGSRRRYSTADLAPGQTRLIVSENNQDFSLVSASAIYLIRFGKAPSSPNWTWEGIAADPDPIRYYMADRLRFIGLLPQWGLDDYLRRSIDWDPDLVPDAYSLDFTFEIEALLASGIPIAQLGTIIVLPFPTRGSTAEEQAAAASTLTAILARLIKNTANFSYVVYQKQNMADPTKYYVGRTSGWGDPGRVLKRRDQNHERQFDHRAAEVDAYVWQDFPHFASRAAMRGREQQRIDSYGGLVADGGRATNTIRGISRLNLAWKTYHLTSNNYWGEIAPYDGPDIPGFALSTPVWITIYWKHP